MCRSLYSAYHRWESVPPKHWTEKDDYRTCQTWLSKEKGFLAYNQRTYYTNQQNQRVLCGRLLAVTQNIPFPSSVIIGFCQHTIIQNKDDIYQPPLKLDVCMWLGFCQYSVSGSYVCNFYITSLKKKVLALFLPFLWTGTQLGLQRISLLNESMCWAPAVF